jgi:hypothetical protein
MDQLVPVTRAILAAMGRDVHANAIISGDYTNVSASGIHTQIAARDVHTYHVWGPAYGATQRMEFGPTSGSNQVKPLLSQIGIKPSPGQLESFVNACKQECNARKAPLSDSEIMARAIMRFDEKESPLRVDEYVLSITRGATHFAMRGSMDGAAFSRRMNNGGDLQTVIKTLHGIVAPRGYDFEFFDLAVRLVPTIDKKTLLAGIIPAHLGLDSKMCATTTIRGADGQLYAATNVHDRSMHTIIESAINAVQDYGLIKSIRRT